MKPADRMEASDRLKAYQGFAENSRKWVSVMDAKAGFISAMNAGLLTFIWTGAKLTTSPGLARCLAMTATVLAIVSLLLALWIVLPRIQLSSVFGKSASYLPEYEPVSFYGHVAGTYTTAQWPNYRKAVDAMDETAFAEESLEQHFTVSHILHNKCGWLSRSGLALLLAVLLTGIALFAKELA